MIEVEAVVFPLFINDHDFRVIQVDKFDVASDYRLHLFKREVGSIGGLYRLARSVCFNDFCHLFQI